MHKYDLPLTNWINIGLRIQGLEAAVQAIQSGAKIDGNAGDSPQNRKYIEKILKEEVFNQFSSKQRPMLEVILNAIDARPQQQTTPYDVRIYAGGRFKVEDNGEGMDLKDILELLIIPFNTKKDGIHQIGKFGVGFISTLNYCISEPEKATVTLETQKGDDRYRIQFYSTAKEVSGLRMSIEKIRKKKRGTMVKIKSSSSNARFREKDSLLEYFESELQNIPSYVARIFLGNDRQINDDSEQQWASYPVTFKYNGADFAQRVGLQIIDNPNENTIRLNSQGIPVKKLSVNHGAATISFPSLVQVVEGRDEFKIDDNYNLAVEGVFKALYDYIKAQKPSAALTTKMANFIPSLASAFGLTTLQRIPDLKGLEESLLNGRQYVFRRSHRDMLYPFVGNYLDQIGFAVDDHAFSYWLERFKNIEAFFAEVLKPTKSWAPKELRTAIAMDDTGFPNLRHLRERIDTYALMSIDFIELPSSGVSLFLIKPSKTDKHKGHQLYINVNHPKIVGGFDHTKAYGVLAAYCEDAGLGAYMINGALNDENLLREYQYASLAPKSFLKAEQTSQAATAAGKASRAVIEQKEQRVIQIPEEAKNANK
ncbi:ATP-binding protein [Candidatus Pacearchaeota archaeon]|nr:ATP-binding protein [Candidatus Pacearchaeota archaeon]